MERLKAEIERLRAAHQYRALREPEGRDFTSNDYLGLAAHPSLRDAVREALDQYGIVGAGGSRLLRGHHPLHAALEAKAANFFGVERALYFGSGYLANLALFTTIPTRHDAIVFDEYVHASMKEGIHAGAAAKFRAHHNDVQSFEDNLKRARDNGADEIFVAVESLYSMDGDFAPLVELRALAERFEATLVVDEAHATGVFGKRGRGCAEILPGNNTIAVHTGGKALGVAGALVTGPTIIADYLVNRARPFIYSTAPPPFLAAALSRALDLVDEEPERRDRVHILARLANDAIKNATGALSHHSASQIIPVILGAEERALAVAECLSKDGFDVRAIRPPTVPMGTARLRLSINAAQSEDDIAALGRSLGKALNAP
jgi:8-amino-7-oxononanoate synthase